MKDEKVEQAIGVLKEKVVAKEKDLNQMKRIVNELCTSLGEEPIYVLSSEEPGLTGTMPTLKGHEFYMQPLAVVIADILKMNKGPATVKEIYEQMIVGGYEFGASSNVNAMRGLRISMSKNVTKFHKLPNGKFGLTEWFPELKSKIQTKPKKRKKKKKRKKRAARSKKPRKTEHQNQTEGTEVEEANENEQNG